MRLQRNKHNRKTLDYYNFSHDFKPPYIVLVDGEFIENNLKSIWSFSKHIDNALCSKPHQFRTTKCILKYAETDKHMDKRVLPELKRMIMVPCLHKADSPNRGCLASLVCGGNPKKYLVALGRGDTIKLVKKKPEVPILAMQGPNCMILKPSNRSLENHQENEAENIKQIIASSASNPSISKIGRKSNKPKNPHPLSCLKKKRKDTQPTPTTDRVKKTRRGGGKHKKTAEKTTEKNAEKTTDQPTQKPQAKGAEGKGAEGKGAEGKGAGKALSTADKKQ